MACCGVASALTITEDTTMAPADNYYAGPFDFTLTIQDISGYTDGSAEYLLGYYANPAAGGGYAANVFTLNFDGNGNATLSLHRVYSVTVTDGAITAIGSIHNSSVFQANGSNYTLGVGTYKVDYLGGGNGSAAADLYLGDVKVASFTKGSHNMNGGGGDGTATLNVTVGSLTVNKAIPEPTTATLSLLALAGLAARRRRK